MGLCTAQIKADRPHAHITLRGEPVAELVPPQRHKQADTRVVVEKLRAFMAEAPAIDAAELKALIDEGRA